MLAKQTLIQWFEGGNDALNVSFASSVDFPTWFGAGCFGGLACCMFAIAINALYTTLRRRGTTRQLAGAVVTCVISALLLLPAFVWYDQRVGTGFTASEGATLSFAEVGVVFVYVALWGWLLPLSATITYCLFALPRSHDESGSYSDSMRLPGFRAYLSPRQDAAGVAGTSNAPNTPVPFVFGEGGGKLTTLQVWGWLEYSNGRLQGQRLALKQTVVKLGRGEDNDIWLDDEKASRDHAQLIWHLGTIYIIPCDIRNAVLLNGQRIHGPTIVRQGDVFEVGSQRFLFEYAERSNTAEHGDPLQRGVLERNITMNRRRAPITPIPVDRNPSALTKPLKDDGDSYNPPDEYATIASQLPITNRSEPSQPWQETAVLDPVAQAAAVRTDKRSSAFLIRGGEMAGKGFLLDRPVLTIGRGVESDVIINDVSISRLHAQVLRQANGDYVQDLASRNGTKVNNEPLQAPRLLRQGDIVCLGEVRMEYTSVSTALTTPLQPLPLPSRARSISGPVPLRLPSKPKKV